MRFVETAVAGALVVEADLFHDERGFFARTWCEEEAARHGAPLRTVQCNVSFNAKRGTLRGMHYQAPPFEEIKLVRCTAGALLDVAVDIRPGSPTYGRHAAVELTATNHRALYIPAGCAHGFITLADDTEVAYQMSQFYAPGHGRGFRWNDPAFALDWPEPVVVIAERDRTYPDFVAPAGDGGPR
jgi:dTDP-4-dehydrorhamnose 3,5-epimerase